MRSKKYIQCFALIIVFAVSGLMNQSKLYSRDTVSRGAAPESPVVQAPTVVQFSSGNYVVSEGCTTIDITVNRSGNVSSVSVVDYTLTNLSATQRGDYTYGKGTLVFNANETSKSFPVLISEDAYFEGDEGITMTLSNAVLALLGTPSTAMLTITDNDALDGSFNPLDDAQVFVGQQYHDFLNRQADSQGQQFWANQIVNCGSNANCLVATRTNVSTAFFISIEFQQTGYFAFRFYRTSFLDSAQRPRGLPRYPEFLRDTQQLQHLVVVGQPNWEAFLEQNKQGFALDWVARTDFIAEYPTNMTRDEFIDQAFARAGATPTTQERNQALFAYESGFSLKEKRAFGFRKVVETGAVYNAQYNSAFVLAQYFGYLRRNPNNQPDNNFDGFDFWLNKMNFFSRPGEDMQNANTALARVQRADMVKAFITSVEYRERFQGGLERGNQQGSIARAKLPAAKTVARVFSSKRVR